MERQRTEVADIDRSLYDITAIRISIDEGPHARDRDRDLPPQGRARLDARLPPEVARDLPLDARPHLGALHRRARHGPHRHLREAQHRPGRHLGRGARRHQEHLRAPGHPRGRAQLPSPAWVPSTTRNSSTTTCRTPPPRWGSSTRASRRRSTSPSGRSSSGAGSWTLIPPKGPQVRRAPRRGVVGRVVRLRARRHQARLPAAELLPPQRQGRGAVRAHAHHR